MTLSWLFVLSFQSLHIQKTWKLVPSTLNCQQILTKISFVISDIVKKKQIKCGLVWSVLLLAMLLVITVVKICCGLTQLLSCALWIHNIWSLWWRILLSIRVQSTLNHCIRFVNFMAKQPALSFLRCFFAWKIPTPECQITRVQIPCVKALKHCVAYNFSWNGVSIKLIALSVWRLNITSFSSYMPSVQSL